MKEIVQDGAPILRETAKVVPESLFGSAELTQLIIDMSETLDRFPEGVALAAPQIGVSYRLFIVRMDRTLPPIENDDKAPTLPAEVEVYINPEIVKTSKKRARTDEGCLSVHGIYGTTNRHERVTIKARRPDGSHLSRGAGGLLAQIFEHEIDHLNGILFTDHAEHLIRLGKKPEYTFAYFGTPKVASATLATLIEEGLTPSLVVTSPDAPRGRGLTLTPSETNIVATNHKIPVLTPAKLDAAAIREIAAHKCDYAIVVAYGKIFPDELIALFPKGVFNVHYSLLPKYRGATPLESALLAGDEQTGVTLQKMVKELDAGDIIAQEATDIEETDTIRELRPRLIELGAQMLVDDLPAYLLGDLVAFPQDASKVSRAHKFKKEDGELSLDAPDRENWSKYRSFADTIGTYFFYKGKRIKIVLATLKNGKFVIQRVVPEGKKEVAYSDFIKNN